MANPIESILQRMEKKIDALGGKLDSLLRALIDEDVDLPDTTLDGLSMPSERDPNTTL